MPQETMSFQTEVKQLLQLMIHSLYSNKEIFLRELISNASDAIDKLRFESLAETSLIEEDKEFKIRVVFDNHDRTITIEDNGIGMSREEAITHLGTIAKSGTKEFFKNLSGDKQKDAALIGQFGVGFYSAFIVADKVDLESRRAGLDEEKGIRWTSKGDGEFSIETISRKKRGTKITLHIRENEDELLSSWKLKTIIQKYSDHITVPIEMQKEEWDENKKSLIKKNEFEQVNEALALWAKPKKDITDEQYKDFYKHISHDSSDPLIWSHNRIEGSSEYILLLYIPQRANFDLWDRNHQSGLKLYVKRVFIMDEGGGSLCPNYLRFLRGIIDSNDLPLNVSREILQESKDVKNIREKVTRAALNMLERLAESTDNQSDSQKNYQTFWNEFGQVIKEGIGEDHSNRERIAKLLRFSSTHNNSPAQIVSLDEYIGRMKEHQTKIYYVIADSFSAANNSPHLEIFRKKEYEVLLLTDRVDEWMLSFLHEYNGKPLASVARGTLDINEDDKEENDTKIESSMSPILDGFKRVLKEQIKDARWTKRLTESPACLVVDDGDMSNHLQRLLKASGQKLPTTKPIMELNVDHQLIKRLCPEDQNFSDWCQVLFQQAILAEGGNLDDPASFVKMSNKLLLNQMT